MVYEVTGTFSVSGCVLVEAETPAQAREKAEAGEWLEHHLWGTVPASDVGFEATGEVYEGDGQARAA